MGRWTHREAGEEAGWQEGRQADSQAGRKQGTQAGRQAGRPAGRQTEGHAILQAGQQVKRSDGVGSTTYRNQLFEVVRIGVGTGPCLVTATRGREENTRNEGQSHGVSSARGKVRKQL